MEEKTYSGFVAIVGKPNVGKSTLLNNLLGVKVAPISPKPQTTRKRLRGILTEGNRQIVFVDTPGLHKPMDAKGEFKDQEVYDALSDVNAVVSEVDHRHPPTPEDELVAKALKPLVGKVPILLVGNKLDAARYPEDALKAYHALLPEAEARMLSALDERQVAELKAQLADLQGNIERAQRAIAELRQRSVARQQEFRKDVENELTRVNLDVQADAERVYGVESNGRVIALRREDGARAWANERLL
ncbi:MAG: GTPase, partial [Thermus sp.]